MMYKFLEEFYYTLLYIFYILYFLVILNLAYFESITAYLPVVQSSLKYFVILFLIIRFNPYSHEKFTDFDKKIVFSSSFFYFRQLQLRMHYCLISIKVLHIEWESI